MLRLIVGLGNPGPRYKNTRHNAGTWAIEEWARQEGWSFKSQNKFFGSVSGHSALWLLIPHTYMNESGQAVGAMARFYQIPPEAILVAHDELDMPAGQIRLKTGGGHGGHNGLRSVIQHLGSPNFHRLRIGIAHPGHKDRVLEHVLSVPSMDEKIEIDRAIERALAIKSLITEAKWGEAMNTLHSSP